MEKTISVRRTTITFSIWDLGGQREFVNMLPLVCNDAVAILFMFDLSRKSTLNSVKEWYRQARGFNKVFVSFSLRSFETNHQSSVSQTAIPFLIGTKFDQFATFPRDEQEEITKQVSFLPFTLVIITHSALPSGKAFCTCHARIFDILLYISFDKCTEDIQNCARESFRPEMRDSRN